MRVPATWLCPGADPVTLNGVPIKERAPPEGERPIAWSLLTSLKVVSAWDAEWVLGYDLTRWRIEDFVRVLKNGCKVERMVLGAAYRLERGVAMYGVIAWRLMVLTLLGRPLPELDRRLHRHGSSIPDRLR